MHRLFGSKKPAAPAVAAPTLEETVGRLDTRVTGLDEKIKAIDKELIGYREQLKRLPPSAQAGVKSKAMQALKRKKMYEGQREQMLRQQFSVEQTHFALESIKDTHATVAAMKGAATAMKAEHAKIDIDEIEDMQDDMEEFMYMSEEINELMGRSYGVPTVSDGDLESELAGLQEEWAAEADSSAVPDYLADVPPMPAVPTGLPMPPVSYPVAQ